MKFAFLGSKPSVIIVGVVIGLYAGFRIANSQYRVAIEQNLARSLAGGAAAGGGQADGGSAALDQAKAAIEAARQNPQDVDAQLDAADQFIQIGRPDEARPFLEQAQRVSPTDGRVVAALGMTSFMKGEYQQSIALATQALAADPQNTGARFLLIVSYIRTSQKLDEAESMLNSLESGGIDPRMTAKVREELATARGGQSGRTMLDHGPDEKSPVKGSR